MSTCHFMNSDLNKQTQALEVTFSRKTKSYHSQTCFNNILRIYLNEKLNFYYYIIERNAQMHITDITIFYCKAGIFRYLHLPSTITDTSQIPSTRTLAKYLNTQCAEAFKPYNIGTYHFFITPSFLMGNQDQLKYQLGSVNIGLDQLILVRIG